MNLTLLRSNLVLYAMISFMAYCATVQYACANVRRCLNLSPVLNTDGSQRKETAQADNLLDIGTRKIFNEDYDIFRRSVRKFFQEEVLPFHSE